MLINKDILTIIKKANIGIPNIVKTTEEILSMDTSDQIDYLAVSIFDAYNKHIIDKEKFLKIIRQIQGIDVQLYPTPEKVLERIKWLEDMDLKYTQTGISQNHKEVLEIFDKFNIMTSQNNIDHYYTSGILPFLLTNTELQRFHHDIDIFVNLEQLKLLEDTGEKYGFNFIRKFGYRDDGLKRRIIKMYYKNYDLPMTIFMFQRTKDGFVVQNEFIYDENGNLKVEEMYNTPECVELSFSDKINFHNNIPYKAITMEALYECKDGLRPKDIYDCKIMERYVDKEKLKKLKQQLKLCPKNKIFDVEDINMRSFINGDDLER